MTTGTLSRNNRVPYAGSWATYYIGHTFYKTWNGADGTVQRPARVWVPPYQTALLDKRSQKPIVIPGYYKRSIDPRVRKAREPHNYTLTRKSSHGGYIDTLIGSWKNYAFGDTGATPTYGGSYTLPYPGATWDSNDDIALINKLRNRMMGSAFDPALFLSQLDQTLGMIFTTARRVDASLRFIRRGQLNDAARILTVGTTTSGRKHRDFNPRGLTPENVASAQLELSYGWLPLLADAYGSAQYVAHHTQLPMRQRFRVRRFRSFQCGHPSPTLWAFRSQNNRVQGQLIAEMREGFNFSPTYLLGLDDPLSMAWERLPWSFVADWFIPIQNYLQDRAFARQVQGTFIKTVNVRVDVQGLKPLVSTERLTPGKPDSFRETSLSLTRTVTSSLSVPYPKPRSFLEVPSWRRAINAVSLALQRNGSGSPAALILGAAVAPTAAVVVGRSLSQAADDVASAT